MDYRLLTDQLNQLPLYRYEFLHTQELTFSDRVRHVCRTECPQYGRSWACPPAVGTVDECRSRIGRYQRALLISTITEVSDIANIEETLLTRAPHEEITREVRSLLQTQTQDILTLSTESCAICEHCAYPDGPCRYPQRMFPCVESYGILVTDIAEKYDIDFLAGGNIVTWFSILFYNE